MSYTEIEIMLWHIERELMLRHGVDQAQRDIAPLRWYVDTGRATTQFLRLLRDTRPVLVARDLHKSGSYDETISRVCKRIGYHISD